MLYSLVCELYSSNLSCSDPRAKETGKQEPSDGKVRLIIRYRKTFLTKHRNRFGIIPFIFLYLSIQSMIQKEELLQCMRYI